MVSNQQHKWRTSSGLAFWGSAIQAAFCFLGLAIILYVLYNFVDIAMSGIVNSIISMNSDYLTDEMENYGATAMLFFIFSFLGCIVYLIGICLFKGAQVSPNSERRIRNIMLTELIMPALLILVVVIVYNSPEIIKDGGDVIGLLLLMWLGSLAAVIFLLLQFRSLSKEETWSEKSRKGAADVKFSYACILWNQLVIILGIVIILLTLYSFRSRIQSMRFDIYGMNDVYNGVNSLSDLVNTFKVSIQLEVVFISLLVFISGILQTIFRIAGWRKIQTGINESRSASPRRYSESGRFCHKCGAELPEDSAFCPGCGAPVAVVVSSVEVEEPERILLLRPRVILSQNR